MIRKLSNTVFRVTPTWLRFGWATPPSKRAINALPRKKAMNQQQD